jgi:hypothetical protein
VEHEAGVSEKEAATEELEACGDGVAGVEKRDADIKVRDGDSYNTGGYDRGRGPRASVSALLRARR